MSHEVLMRALELGDNDEDFAIVGVTKTEGPTAVKAGNKSIIRADGRIEGWVGGHCTEDEIVRSALESIKDGTIRTLRLSTCQGGTMEVYVEPYPQRRKLVVVGHVPIAVALLRLAKMLNFSVLLIDRKDGAKKQPDISVEDLDDLDAVSLTKNTYVVIATMGNRDQEAAVKFVRSPAPYVGIVAGKKRAHEILTFLRSEGVSEEQLAKVKSPAGIHIRAVTAEEIALSIMAEIVELARSKIEEIGEIAGEFTRRAAKGQEVAAVAIQPRNEGGGAARVVVDPVCGMTVNTAESPYHSTVQEGTVYFCSESCKKQFDKNPSKYLTNQKMMESISTPKADGR